MLTPAVADECGEDEIDGVAMKEPEVMRPVLCYSLRWPMIGSTAERRWSSRLIVGVLAGADTRNGGGVSDTLRNME